MDSIQQERYGDFYSRWRRLRWLFRFDVRYRCHRLNEVLDELGVDTHRCRVLDVGFGSGHLLASLPCDCDVVGAEISESAVSAAASTDEFRKFPSAHFVLVDEQPDSLPPGPFDIILSSHTLEHVFDDLATLAAIRSRLRDGGVLAVFVPIEEPDYITYHVRTYSMQSLKQSVRQAGLEMLAAEGSMFVNGHIWRLLTIPSRRQWPVFGPLADAFRLATLSAHPYRLTRALDQLMYRLGFRPRQGLIIARKPPESSTQQHAGPGAATHGPRASAFQPATPRT